MEAIVETRTGKGACEVVVYTQDPGASLGSLPLSHIDLLLSVWGDPYREFGAHPDVRYVMPFENRGVEAGVTLNHPHGQIFAYPFVPPIPERELGAGMFTADTLPEEKAAELRAVDVELD